MNHSANNLNEFNLSELSETRKIFKKSLGKSFQESAFRYGCGTISALCGDMEGAGKQFRKGLDVRGASPFLRMNLGRSLECSRDYLHAVEEYKKILEIAPSRAEVIMALVRIYCNIEAFPEAEKCLQEFIAAFPTHQDIHSLYNCLAGIYISQSETDKALATLLKHEEIFDESLSPVQRAHISNNIGILYCKKEYWQQAMEKFRQALKHFPEYSPARKNVAMVAENLNKETEDNA